eukprot:2262794-Amphidinium_carterae.1
MAAQDQERVDGRHWHGGALLNPGATRAALLRPGDPPHTKVVVFHESKFGQAVFDASLKRAQTSGIPQRRAYLSSLARLLAVVQRNGWDRVEVAYNDPHEAERDLMLVQDVHRNARCLVVAGIQNGGPAEQAGLTESWLLPRVPDGMSIHAPRAGPGYA